MVLPMSPRLASKRKGVVLASSRSSMSAFQPSGPYCSQKALFGLKQHTCSSVWRTTSRQCRSAPAAPPAMRSGSGSSPTQRSVCRSLGRARDQGVDIVAFPELAITGYPPEDLVLKPGFVRDNLKHLQIVAGATNGISAVVGFVDEDGDLYNAAAFMHDGEIKAVYHKVFLPNYGVFDEQRYFAPGHRSPILELSGIRVGVTICEDCWYPSGPMAWQAYHGAELLININGSPYHCGKRGPREEMVAGRAADYV